MGIIDEAREELKKTNTSKIVDQEQEALDNSLYAAILQKDLKAVDAAIESGANVNACGGVVKKRGYFITSFSPLRTVFQQSFYDKGLKKGFSEYVDFSIAERLIAAGANPYEVLAEIIKWVGYGTEQYYVRNKWLYYLLDRTQDLSRLLHLAAIANDSSIIFTLIEKGADVNNIWKGDTPLHEAVKNNSFEAVKELLKAGASLTQKNRDNLTVFDIAIENNHLRLATYLTKKLNYSSWDDSEHRVQVDIYNQLFRIANFIEIYLYANVLQDEKEEEEDEEYE